MIGKTISHYRIIEKLGEGGMGVVYKAEDTKLKRTVALKFLPKDMTRDIKAKERFVQEAQAAAALNDPHICVIHEIDEVDKHSFIVMEYIDGQNLRQKIESEWLTINEIVDLATQVAEGLREAHENNIVHRDIKSANIMMTKKGKTKIMDFGLAKLAGQTKLTKEGTTAGTVAYMSPEQAGGEQVDHRTDIWSLGVVMYEMISSQLPFGGEYEQVVIYSIMNKDPKPISECRTDVPFQLEQVVRKTLAKNLDERYQQMDEILTDLKKLKKQLETAGEYQPRKVVNVEFRKKQIKRIPILIAIVLTMALGSFFLRPYLFEQSANFEPKHIAIISFANQTGREEYDYLREVIPNLLITSLEQSEYLRVITRERMNDILKQMGKQNVEFIDKNLGFELCRRDDISAIVLGSFIKAGDMFATDAKVLDVTTKRLLKSVTVKGKGVESILKNQIDELSRYISQGVGITDREIEATQLPIIDVTTTSMEAYHYFLRGREDWEKHYYDDAKQFLLRAVQLDSTFAVAYLYLARTYQWLDDTRARNRAYEKAKTFAAKATEKERLYIEAAYARMIERNPEKKFRILEQMMKKYPKEKLAYLEMAYYYYRKKMFHQAMEVLHKGLELDPNYGYAINLLAFTHANIGNYEKAIEYFKRYAYIHPGAPNPFDSMAEIYLRMGDLDEAIARYKEALEVKPDFGAEWRIAYIYALKEDYQEVMKWIDQFIARAPSPGVKARGYVWKGFYYYWLGHLEQAHRILDAATGLAKTVGNEIWKAYADWMKAWIYFEQGKLQLSQSYFKSYYEFTIKNYPQDIPRYTAVYDFYLGLVDLKNRQIDSTKSRFAEMKLVLPKIDAAYKNQITCYYNLLYTNILLAEDSLEKAITVGKKIVPLEIPSMYTSKILCYNLPLLKDILAYAYQQNGMLNQAIAEYERLITFDPNSKDRRLSHPKYHYRLAQLYEEQGMSAMAIEHYKKFLQIYKDADKDLPELIDSRTRLVKLSSKQ